MKMEGGKGERVGSSRLRELQSLIKGLGGLEWNLGKSLEK